jgi:GrpB-like predicted nucleotidyltransferase (UPF0157 family)
LNGGPAEPALGLRGGTTIVRAYDPRWQHEFEREAAILGSLLGELVSAIEHVGSTAVPGLAAKPVLDIAISFTDASRLAEARRRLNASGYEDRGDQGDHGGVVFAKGPASSRTHYLHLVEAGSDQWLRYLGFRDALRRDPLRRSRYEALKKRLAARFPRDRSSYQRTKGEFVEETLATLSAALHVQRGNP